MLTNDHVFWFVTRYAIESIESYRFTSESDVWSYGVTIWEMFMLLGSREQHATPYKDITSPNICDKVCDFNFIIHCCFKYADLSLWPVLRECLVNPLVYLNSVLDARSPDKNQRLVVINYKDIYHVKYSVLEFSVCSLFSLNKGRFCNNSEIDTLISKRLYVEN